MTHHAANNQPVGGDSQPPETVAIASRTFREQVERCLLFGTLQHQSRGQTTNMAAINWFGPINKQMVLVSERKEGNITVSEYRCGKMTIRVRENAPTDAAISQAAKVIHEIAAKHVTEHENPKTAAA